MSDKKIFLIVDDDDDDRDFFCEAVIEIDPSAKCETARNGEHALAKLRNGIKQLPDFIFLDINMPRMDGWQCLTELKGEKKLENIPVIIISTSSSQNDIDKAQQLGAFYFLTKPSNFEKLKKEIVFVTNTI
jgi:CheY-like chemotaxis protein